MREVECWSIGKLQGMKAEGGRWNAGVLECWETAKAEG